ncbi:GNAT family N-acetyltransferase [Megalodesulfovibrio paquesii]
MLKLQHYAVRVGGQELLPAIEPMWRALCEHHAQVAPVFADWFRCRPFADRAAEVLGHASGGLLVQLGMVDDVAVGFCISSITATGAGEIDSIFVASEHRGAGLGEQFMRQALHWLDEHGAAPISLAVVAGNERALNWYGRFGFTPRRIQLQRTRTSRE